MFSFANSTRPACFSARSASTGSTALQGPHHGAQQSITTGFSAWTAAVSKVSSVISRTTAGYRPSETAGQGSEAKGRDLPDRLQDDRLAHLRAADLAVGERDRNLDDPEAGP